MHQPIKLPTQADLLPAHSLPDPNRSDLQALEANPAWHLIRWVLWEAGCPDPCRAADVKKSDEEIAREARGRAAVANALAMIDARFSVIRKREKG